MSNVLTHVFVSAKADVSDATKVGSAKWNDGHKFAGGSNGNVLVRDTSDATYGAAFVSAIKLGPDNASFNTTSRTLYDDIALNRIGAINGGKTLNFLGLNETSDATSDNYGVVGAAVNTNAANAKHLMCGTTGEAVHKGAGNAGGLTLVGTAGVARVDSAFTVGACIAMLCSPNLNGGGGTITTNYGLYVDNQTIGVANYAIYTNAGFVRFGDTVILNGGAVGVNPLTGIGYTTGAGGTVTQATSKATTVVLSKVVGQITMNGAALAAGTIVSFTLTNTAIAVGDVLVLNHVSGGTPGSYTLNARAAAGSATIDVRNNTAGSLSEAIVIGFALLKGATS